MNKVILLLLISIALFPPFISSSVLANDVNVSLDSPDPNITSVWNDYTNDSSTSLNIDPDTTIEFGVKSDQEIDIWYWTNVDDVTTDTNSSNATKYFESSGSYTVEVYGENMNGTTDTTTWSINIEEEEDEDEGGAPPGGGGEEPAPTEPAPEPTPAPSADTPWLILMLAILAIIIAFIIIGLKKENLF